MNGQSPASPLPVVAGYDGSSTAQAALEYAAHEARERGVPLLLVHGFTWPWIYPPLLAPSEPPPDPHPRSVAGRQLAEAARLLAERFPGLPVRTRLVDGHGAQVLVDHSRDACVVVLGHRGAGGFTGLLVGSVAIHTAAHALSPVIVVRGNPGKPDAAVVLGVDGSPDGERAADFAFATAARRGVPLLAVTVGPPATDRYRHPQPAPDFAHRALAGRPDEYPQVALHTEVVRAGSVAAALIHAAGQAGLVVVGSRGLGGLRGLLLGSVGRALIEHAPCPVAVVRPHE
jgi:nucleotide-binding universal stress UspA family protein